MRGGAIEGDTVTVFRVDITDKWGHELGSTEIKVCFLS